jgi:hypothetical protein
MGILENSVEKYLVRQCQKFGLLALKLKIPSIRGASDRIILSTNGRVFFVECKRPKGGVISPHQTAWEKLLNRRGFRPFTVKDFDEVDDVISSILQEISGDTFAF